MNKYLFYIGLLLLIGCSNENNNEKWAAIKKDRKFDELLIFASKNLSNSYSDSVMTYLADTSLHFITHGIVIKDSINFKTNQPEIYPDFEYGCVTPIPPFKKRVTFRIQIKSNDSIFVNNSLCKQEVIKTRLIEFVLNKNNLDSLPPIRIEKTNEWGDIAITVAAVEIYCDLNELGFKKNYLEKIAQLMSLTYNGYNEIRNVKSKEVLKKRFSELNRKRSGIGLL